MKPGTLVLQERFRVVRHLGGGGMAEVYLAEQLSLQRKVALKVLKRDLGKRPEMAERFRREARILSAVDHPSLVRVIDFESSPEATVLVLELAEGETLEQALRDGPLEPHRAMSLLAQLAEGLGVIHAMGIVHRDIKPQNVVLKMTPQGEQARLLDFGIARLMELPDDEASHPQLATSSNPLVSQPGQVVGTPAYVAPEQATGSPLDARTDVYAFGVLAFRVLSAQFPFPGPSSRDYLQQHVNVAPRELTDAVPGLSTHPKLVELVMQCLAKRPNDRPANGQALLARLTAMLPDDDPTTSAASTPSRRVLSPLVSPGADVQVIRWRWRRRLSRWSMAARQGLGAAADTTAHWARRLDAQWRKSLAVVAGLVALASAGLSLLPPSAPERAAALIEAGRCDEALTLIDEQLKRTPRLRPQLLALKAAALHTAARFDEERQVLRENPYQALHAAHPLLLKALAEDFSLAETDPELTALLGLVPQRMLHPAFEAMAQAPLSRQQWGALRFLDVSEAHQNIDRVDLYARSLESTQCRTRAAAANRLSQLGDLDAVTALRKLSETPKLDGPQGAINCGQDEAAEAIRQLKKTAEKRDEVTAAP